MEKHDYKGRISGLNIEIERLLDDFAKKHGLKEGCPYRVIKNNGDYLDGFFKKLEVSTYRNEMNVWCCFYRVKKDGTPSKVGAVTHITDILDIILPF